VAPAPQEEVYRELVRLLFVEGGRTLGEAVTDAELLAWTGGWADEDVLRAWVLLGDPASRLR
ncbi:MAG: hypothetical protein HY720_33305, partial [Planctomycetes bacterium]|nr:hypothetical protein [Planctomycetota bacterium]